MNDPTDKTNESTDKTNESTDKTNESTDKVNDPTDKTNESDDKSSDPSDGPNDNQSSGTVTNPTEKNKGTIADNKPDVKGSDDHSQSEEGSAGHAQDKESKPKNERESLARTGASVIALTSCAMLLLLAGMALSLINRRRKS